MEYVEEFEKLSMPLEDVSEGCLIEAFLHGLKPEVQAELKMTDVKLIDEVIVKAMCADEKQQLLGEEKGVRSNRTQRNGIGPKLGSAQLVYSRVIHTTKPSRGFLAISSLTHTDASKKTDTKGLELRIASTSAGSSTAFKGGGSRRLTDSEIARRRELGLCFKCGDKYNPVHMCKNRNLHMVVLELESQEESDGNDEDGDRKELLNAGVGTTTFMRLSLNSVSRFRSNHTMKVRGLLDKEDIIVLIDSGATHNFISEELLTKGAVGAEEVATYSVTIGNEYAIQRHHCYQNVKLMVQGFEVIQTFYPFPLKGVDVVLGVEWLKSLSKVKVDWGQLIMKLGRKGNRVCLQGEPSLSCTQVSLKSLLRSAKKQKGGIVVEFKGMEQEADLESVVPVEIRALLAKQSEVCHNSRALPPHRAQDHAIVIKPGEQPPNTRPYRYPHAQKNEIEAMVKDMIQAGIIQTSNNPYSSLQCDY